MESKIRIQRLRVASYNIRKARGLDQKRDPMRILRVINSLEADVVALQEADLRLGQRVSALPRDMIEQETDFEVAEVARNDVSLGWHGNAVLVRKDHQVGNVKHIELPGLEPRGAVKVSLKGETPIDIVATHLGLLRRDRQKQLSTLRDASHLPCNALIMGDFNEWSPTGGMIPLERDYAIYSPGHSFHARRPVAKLDRFALGRGISLNDAGVSQTIEARRASDHLPIWADIEFVKSA